MDLAYSLLWTSGLCENLEGAAESHKLVISEGKLAVALGWYYLDALFATMFFVSAFADMKIWCVSVCAGHCNWVNEPICQPH